MNRQSDHATKPMESPLVQTIAWFLLRCPGTQTLEMNWIDSILFFVLFCLPSFGFDSLFSIAQDIRVRAHSHTHINTHTCTPHPSDEKNGKKGTSNSKHMCLLLSVCVIVYACTRAHFAGSTAEDNGIVCLVAFNTSISTSIFQLMRERHRVRLYMHFHTHNQYILQHVSK